MPDVGASHVSRFDLSGYLFLAFSMVAISFATEGMAELGLPRSVVMILLVFGLASLAAYWFHAARTPQPLFSLNLFKIGTYNIGLLGNLFARIGSSSMPFLLPLLLQVGLGYSPSYAGMMMIPMAVAAAGAILNAFSDQFGGPGSAEGVLQTFRATFVCMGIVTCSSAAIFWQIPAQDRSKEPLPQSEPTMH